MDCRNGGNALAPPRPPKLLPRVHRPRAPDPTATTMSDELMASSTQAASMDATAAVAVAAANRAPATPTLAILGRRLPPPPPTCTNISSSSNNNNNNNNSSSSHSNNNNNSLPSIPLRAAHALQTSITNQALSNVLLGNSNNNNNISSNIGSNNNNTVAVILTEPEFEEFPTHHLTYLPQRASNLSRSGSHVSNNSTSTTSSTITAANSFTRRRLLPASPPANMRSNSSSPSVPLLNLHQQQTAHLSAAALQAVPSSPVSLTQPRPESERLTNEYVDTPLRASQQQQQHQQTQQTLQLQHATRSQHPAGEQDDGQTTTHHLLLLPQRELRQQFQQQLQQQQQQQQQHQHLEQHSINRLAGTAGSANATTVMPTRGIDGTDGFIHSHHHKTHALSVVAPSSMSACPQVAPPPPPGSFASCSNPLAVQQPPITKQPASSTSCAAATAAASFAKNCKYAKETNGLEELLEIHHISTPSELSPHRLSSSTHMGTPILLGGDSARRISDGGLTCPRCDRCRCEKCQEPASLPETWLCDKTCLCSAESVIDYVSCLCCAKALFYHCARDNDMDYDDGNGTPCVDNPCSCGPYKRTQRWGWLGALSLVLPCLLCYWPLRGCMSLCEKCYGRLAGKGCRCQQTGASNNMLPNIPLSGLSGATLEHEHAVVGGVCGPAVADGLSKTRFHHHSNTSARSNELTPEKRLLDSNTEF